MARKSPARVRADIPHRLHPGERYDTPGWLSPHGRVAVARLERTRLRPGAVAGALRAWQSFVRDPAHRIWQPTSGCGELFCCPDPVELRWILDITAHALPRQDAREFRRRLAAIDEQW